MRTEMYLDKTQKVFDTHSGDFLGYWTIVVCERIPVSHHRKKGKHWGMEVKQEEYEQQKFFIHPKTGIAENFPGITHAIERLYPDIDDFTMYGTEVSGNSIEAREEVLKEFKRIGVLFADALQILGSERKADRMGFLDKAMGAMERKYGRKKEKVIR